MTQAGAAVGLVAAHALYWSASTLLRAVVSFAWIVVIVRPSLLARSTVRGRYLSDALPSLEWTILKLLRCGTDALSYIALAVASRRCRTLSVALSRHLVNRETRTLRRPSAWPAEAGGQCLTDWLI